MIEQDQQFKKWQWIEVRVEKANKDHRPESHRLYVDTISPAEHIDTKNEWSARRTWLDRLPTFDSFEELEAQRVATGLSLAMLRPKNVRLEISPARHQDWSAEEIAKLMRTELVVVQS